MALRSAPLLLPALVAVALPESCFGSSSHSLMYFCTSVSEPSQGLPQFVSLGYVDAQVFVYYDTSSRVLQPRVSWMEEVGKEDPQFWDTQTQLAHSSEVILRAGLEALRTLYNQSEGLHGWQIMCGCELQGDGSKGGFFRCGYDGRTFITFDKETLTWVAHNPQAQITRRKWDSIPGYNQRLKTYLEEECIEWLEKFLSYGKEMLLRTKAPHGSVAPNADGTYHYWLSIQIDPQERDRYRCHVEHDGLQEPVDVDVKVPESNPGHIIGCLLAAVVLVIAVIVGILMYRSKYPVTTFAGWLWRKVRRFLPSLSLWELLLDWLLPGFPSPLWEHLKCRPLAGTRLDSVESAVRTVPSSS
ncbi:major histocompatibility complex class I-related gene protein-like [Python bivittatus]|uniref:Major histocompatibility complex class I-related gene protein-like n=1 Tax=Python bivittatus TaxID=176946 RepID=A0A9F5J3V8_PYTBI|nr:major histocompatibility complex class I-related gene protein-like [Python bivittatus]